MRKIYYVSAFVIILIISFLGITYSYEYQQNADLVFDLIGPKLLYMDVNTEYVEYGVKILYNGKNISEDVVIDTSGLDVTKLGEYKVKYEVNGEYVYRDVVVIDRIKPVINLMGGEEVFILLNGNYQEPGYTVTDNCSSDLNKKVTVSGSVDVHKEGTYTINYSVVDDSANKGEAVRKVIVKKPVITLENNFSSRVSSNSYNVSLYSNTIYNNKWTSIGIYYEGYVRNAASTYKIKLKSKDGKKEYLYNMNTGNTKNYYSGNLNLAIITNGIYDVYVVGNTSERLVNKLDIYSKIVRAKVGNKLISVSYENDNVTILVDDFNYQYDVAIDPGHGGDEIGAANGIVTEKDLNLKVSKYEKCRYESMGYRVYLVRYDDTYGEMLGNSKIDKLDRRGLTMGYYGAVSRIVYSNHHNGSSDTSERGFEILVSNQITAKELAPEISLYNKFKKFYSINDDKIRMYSKNYNDSTVYQKINGQVYDYKDFYSVIRIPYELYNVKNVIYEPIFMTNANDFNWYYASNNWIKVSEMKIQEYVKYMGGNYNSDNSMCL